MRKLLAVLLSFVCTAAVAQEFPSRPVRIVVPFTPSGPTDVVARIVGEKLSAKWKVPVIVENRPGAGTMIGSDIVAKAAPDGHTVLLAVTAHAVNATLIKKLPYDTVKDFAPLAIIATAPNMLTVNPSVPAKTTGELIAHLKANPGKLNAGSHGKGNTSHLAAEMLKSMTGVEFTIVQYKGAQPAMTALLSGEVDLMFDTGVVVSQIQAGRLRLLGTTGPKRSSLFPDVPTLIESGLNGFDVVSWYGFLTTGGTPKPIVDKLSRDFIDALSQPEVRERIIKYNLEPVGGSADELDRLIKAQIVRWASVIKTAGIEPD